MDDAWGVFGRIFFLLALLCLVVGSGLSGSAEAQSNSSPSSKISIVLDATTKILRLEERR